MRDPREGPSHSIHFSPEESGNGRVRLGRAIEQAHDRPSLSGTALSDPTKRPHPRYGPHPVIRQSRLRFSERSGSLTRLPALS